MTKEEFFDELARIDGWELIPGGIVRKTYYRDSGKVICHCDCPITAVANKKCGRHEYIPDFFEAAARYLGLDRIEANRIMFAADNWEQSEAEYLPRREVLDACGLEEVA
jgi:hypothetical protein